MAIRTDMYSYRDPWQGPVSGSVSRGMQMGDMIDRKKKSERINKIFRQNMRKNPDGSVSFNRAELLSQIAGEDPSTAMQLQDRFQKEDAQKQSQEALIFSEVKTPQDYALARQALAQKGFDTRKYPENFDQSWIKQKVSQGIPTYLDKAKLEAGVGAGINPYQFARLEMAKNRLSLQEQNANRAERRFGFEVDKWQDRENDERAQRNIPGYRRTGEVMTTPQEAMKLREAAAGSEQMIEKLSELRNLVNQRGSFQYFGDDAAKMQSLATEIQLLAKNQDMYNLGVLAGPDLMLLEKITSSPDSMSSLFTKNSTRKAQIDQQLKSIQQKLESKMRASGYEKIGDASPTKKSKAGGISREDAIKELQRRMRERQGAK